MNQRHCTHTLSGSGNAACYSDQSRNMQIPGDKLSAVLAEDACVKAWHSESGDGLQTNEESENVQCANADPLLSEILSEEEPLQFPEPTNFLLKQYSPSCLTRMPKEQLAANYNYLQIRYGELVQAYSNLCEIIRRDNNIHFVSKSDSLEKLIEKKEPPAEESPTPETSEEGSGQKTEGDGKKEKQKVLTRTSNPIRKPHDPDEKDTGIPTLTVKEEMSEEKLSTIFNGHKYTLIGSSYIYEYRALPARFILLQHEIFTYKDMVTGKIRTTSAAKDIKLLSGSRTSSDILGFIANRYYGEGININKQVKLANQEGCPLTKQEIYQWFRKYGSLALAPVVTRMLEILLKQNAIQMDETYWKVMEETLESGRKHCYFWLARTSEKAEHVPKISVVSFVRSRSADELEKILGDYSGTIACDGYGAYDSLEKKRTNLVIACCLQHIRHYFINALKAVPDLRKMSKEQLEQIPSYLIIRKIREIFFRESASKALSKDEQKKIRETEISKLVNELYEVLDSYQGEPHFDKRSLFGKAVIYAQNRKEHIFAALRNPDIPLNNSACERVFIPMAVFRNNSKQFTTRQGAATSALFFSVIDTAKDNGRDPVVYLRYLIETVPQLMKENHVKVENGDFSFLDVCMPWNPESLEFEKKVLLENQQLL